MKTFIVIPVYNEEAAIAECLKSVTAQTVPFDGIVVVDNNCRDRTMEIVRQYPQVTIVEEPQQGMSFARSCGFDYAAHHGADILCRIDADVRLPENYNEVVQEYFKVPGHFKTVAITGPLRIYDSSLKHFLHLESHMIGSLTKRFMGGKVFIRGCNMVLRAETWLQIRRQMSGLERIHEDMDISYQAAKCGQNVFVSDLIAYVSSRTYIKSPRRSANYVWRWVYSFYYLRSS
ncbi:MAG TPA: glycosyltransferase family A protein [Candidatus Saccharimonadales bacterium]|nr:glycosyltransferase family A protein [Candidatus Saccharimonadales bacterium]